MSYRSQEDLLEIPLEASVEKTPVIAKKSLPGGISDKTNIRVLGVADETSSIMFVFCNMFLTLLRVSDINILCL